MRVAVAGKGGSGKTTIAGSLALILGRGGHEVLAVDTDLNPNLGLSLGLGVERTLSLVGARQEMAQAGAGPEKTMEQIVDLFAADVGEGIRVVQVSKLDYAKPD